MDIPWIIVGLAAGMVFVVIGIVLVFVTAKKRQQGILPDYRGLFIMGVIWAPMGLILWTLLDNPGMIGLSVMGVIFLALGIANRDKWQEQQAWSDLHPQEKRLRLILLGVGVVGLVLLAATFFLMQVL
jgi:hypothetical protein